MGIVCSNGCPVRVYFILFEVGDNRPTLLEWLKHIRYLIMSLADNIISWPNAMLAIITRENKSDS